MRVRHFFNLGVVVCSVVYVYLYKASKTFSMFLAPENRTDFQTFHTSISQVPGHSGDVHQ